MKTTPFRFFIAAATILTASPAFAATYQWDTNSSTAGLGGTGTWSGLNWDLIGVGSDTGTDITAVNGFIATADIALFGGTAGTVTVDQTIVPRTLQFAADGYTLATNNSLTGGTTLIFNIGSSFTARSVTVTGSNASFTGATSLQGIHLTVDSLATLGTGNITIGAQNGARTGSLIITELGSAVSTNRIVFGFSGNDPSSLPGGAQTIKNNSATANTLTLTNNIATNGGTNTLSIIGLGGSNTGNNTISGNISNGAQTKTGISKVDAGTWVLTGTNTYGGTYTQAASPFFTAEIGTTISAGRLITGNTSALGVGSVTLAGGTLQVGNGTVHTVALAGGKNITTTAAATLAFNSNLSSIGLSGGGKYDFGGDVVTLDLNNAFNSAGTYNLITGGSGNVDAASYLFQNFDTTNWSATFANGGLVVAAVPEPSTYALVGAGAFAAAAFVRRRRRHAAA